ncbi:MAG: AAA family ATPase [Bacteroidales bacterium]|nr:AAA family ATPase [Bacteroidales bacterium]
METKKTTARTDFEIDFTANAKKRKTQPEKKVAEELDLLSCMEKISDFAENSGLSDNFYRKVERYAKHVAEVLGITVNQSVMLSLIVDLGTDSYVSLHEMAEHLGCRTTRMLKQKKDIEVLVQREMVECSTSCNHHNYHAPADLLDALSDNKPFKPHDYSGLSCRELIDNIHRVFSDFEDDELSFENVMFRIRRMLESNSELRFVQSLDAKDLNPYCRLIVLFFCCKFVCDNDDEISFFDMNFLLGESAMHFEKYSLKDGSSELLENKILEYHCENGMANRELLNLTMDAKRYLLDELNLPSLNGSALKRNMISSKNIKERQLYFSAEVDKKVEELAQLLNHENYSGITERLQQKGFRNGFTCLFYGLPGTGKTETALQLARRTGRDILQVNIAEMRSMWVGESEKNVKALFDNYRRNVQECDRVPILLFNEADAIIGKRQVGAEHSVDKMENSLQDIILQEMESLDGILIATTNIVGNMDNAFERRFLYKIRFDQPTVEARVAIWLEMLPELSPADARFLAERYKFSGGQIENIARHYTIDSILHGLDRPTLEALVPHCDSERINDKQGKEIGYKF